MLSSRWSGWILFAGLVGGVWLWMWWRSAEDAMPTTVVTQNIVSSEAQIRRFSNADAEAQALLRTPIAHDDASATETHVAHRRNAILLLKVCDEGGSPLEGARVLCGAPGESHYGSIEDRNWLDSSLPIHADVRTDREGLARLSNLPEESELVVAAEAEGHVRLQQFVRTSRGGAEPHLGEWRLAPALPVRLTLVDESGAPAPDVAFELSVSLEPEDRRDSSFEGRSDAQGVAVLEHVPPLPATLHLAPSQDYATRFVADVLDFGQREARVMLERGRVVHGRVLDADGNPVVGAQLGLATFVTEHDVEGEVSNLWFMGHVPLEIFRTRILSASDGSFELPGLPADAGLFALTAHLAPDQYYAGTWQSDPRKVEFRLPVRHALRFRLTGPFDPSLAKVNLSRTQSDDSDSWDLVIDDEQNHCAPDGSFERQLPAGTWKIEVRYPGGEEVIEEQLTLDRDRDLGERILSRGSRLRIHWPGSTDAMPPDVRVQIPRRNQKAQDPWRFARIADPRYVGDGVWEFLSIPPNRYRVEMRVPGWEPAAAELTIGIDEIVELTLTPLRAGRVHVTVTDVAGQPCTDRTITLRALISDPPTPREEFLISAPGDFYTFELPLAADGTVENSDVPAGNYEVRLSDPIGVSSGGWDEADGAAIGRIEVHAAELTTFEWSLAGMGKVQFMVYDAGRPAAGVRIAYWRLARPGSLGWGVLDDPRSGGITAGDGSYFAEGLAPGHYVVGVSSGERASWTLRTLDVVTGPQIFEVHRGTATVFGRVQSSTGAPLDAWVTLCSEQLASFTLDPEDLQRRLDLDAWPSAIGLASTTLSLEGAFGFRDLDPGRYRVVAQTHQGEVAWSDWFSVEDRGHAELPDLALEATATIEWQLEGLAAWSDHWLELALRPAVGGEVWMREWVYVSPKDPEHQVRLQLPVGRWAVELLGRDGRVLQHWTEIMIHSNGSVSPGLLPDPKSVGADPNPH
jgi:protocatechuate 3,4-dioxygenase beta subunit